MNIKLSVCFCVTQPTVFSVTEIRCFGFKSPIQFCGTSDHLNALKWEHNQVMSDLKFKEGSIEVWHIIIN